MVKKFITHNLHCGEDYLNPNNTWFDVFVFFMTEMIRTNIFGSLSVGPQTAYIWKHGNVEFGGLFTGLPDSKFQDFKTFLLAGGGLVYYETGGSSPTPFYPGTKPGQTYTCEQLINSACLRLTGAFHPMTGEKRNEVSGRYYGMDAANKYLGEDLNQGLAVKGVINDQPLNNWWAALFCGAERGEYAGPSPFGPNLLAEQYWLSSYLSTFEETPFYWVTGLQTYAVFKPAAGAAGELIGWQFMPVQDYDTSQQIWCFKTMAERFEFVMNWLTNPAWTEGLSAYRMGAYIMAKGAHNKRIWWGLPAVEEQGPGLSKVDWRLYNIPPNIVPRKPSTSVIEEARIIPDMDGDLTMEFGKWRALYTQWIEYARDNWLINPDNIFFSDQQSKGMVVQQYDGNIIITPARLYAIAAYYADIYTSGIWETNNEFDVNPAINITRPPNYIKVTISEETEYYTLSEAYWYLLARLNAIATGASYTDPVLEPIMGPYEKTAYYPEDGDTVYNLSRWAQHNSSLGVNITFAQLMDQIPGIYNNSFTDTELGPDLPYNGNNRKGFRKRVIPIWPLVPGLNVTVNASELLYLMAQMYLNWLSNPTNPAAVAFHPSHLLPKAFYVALQSGIALNPLGQQNQENMFSLTQTWTMKPAVLQPQYR